MSILPKILCFNNHELKYQFNCVQVSGIQQTYHQFHQEAVAHLFTPQLTISNFVGRMLVGIPTILLVKFCSMALAKWILAGVSNTLGIPIKSTNYIPTLNGNGKKSDESKQSGYIQRLFFFSAGFIWCWYGYKVYSICRPCMVGGRPCSFSFLSPELVILSSCKIVLRY